MTSNVKKEIISWIQVIVVAFIIAFLLKTFLFRPTYVIGQSMEPTLSNKQFLIMWKLDYKLGNPERGDIVIIDGEQDKTDNKNLIKRVIGLPGETIEIKNGKIYINNQELEPDYTPVKISGNYEKATIPEGTYFVMGDNRNSSRDSRSSTVGFVERKNIEGKAVIRLWPFNKIGLVK